MDDYYDEQLDMMKRDFKDMEKSVLILQGNLAILTDQLKDTQSYLMRVAKNQSEIAKRITNWPYIAVPMGDQD